MLDWTIFILCITLSFCFSILLAYVADFIKFVREKKKEERLQTLNDTVDSILAYKKEVDMSNVVIDLKDTDYTSHDDKVYNIKDYNRLKPKTPEELSDAFLDDLASRRLIYSDDMRMWFPEDKKKR